MRNRIYAVAALVALYLLAVAALVRAGDAERDRLFRAVAAVESGGNPQKRNASEDAVGIVQIRDLTVGSFSALMEA